MTAGKVKVIHLVLRSYVLIYSNQLNRKMLIIIFTQNTIRLDVSSTGYILVIFLKSSVVIFVSKNLILSTFDNCPYCLTVS